MEEVKPIKRVRKPTIEKIGKKEKNSKEENNNIDCIKFENTEQEIETLK